MEDLKNEFTQKAGLTDAQAENCVQLVSAYLKARIPGVMHTQMDKILAGNNLEESIRKQLEEIGGDLKTRTEGLAKDLKSAFEGAFSNKKNS